MEQEFGKCEYCGSVGNTENLTQRNICGTLECEAKRANDIAEFEKNKRYE